MTARVTVQPLMLALALVAAAIAADPVPPEVSSDSDPLSVAELTERVQYLEASLQRLPTGDEAVTAPGDFPHSVRIPGTSLSVKLGGVFKGDVIHDFNAIGSKDNFAPLTIPTDGRDGENTRLHARQTRLNLDFRWPTDLGNAKFFAEGDFFGLASSWRLRHAYAELGPLIVGQTWTTFTHIEALPETVDFESPGAFILTRRGIVRWTARPTDQIAFAMAIEDPTFTIPNPASLPLFPLSGEVETPWPDFVGHVRYIASTTGYGLNWSAVLDFNDKNRLTFLAGFGEGVAGLRGRTDGAEVDAIAASFSEGGLTAVGTPQQVATRFPSRNTVVC